MENTIKGSYFRGRSGREGQECLSAEKKRRKSKYDTKLRYCYYSQ